MRMKQVLVVDSVLSGARGDHRLGRHRRKLPCHLGDCKLPCVQDLVLVQGFAETVEEQNEGIGSPLVRCPAVNGSPGYILVEELLFDRLDRSEQRAAQVAFKFCGSLDHAGTLPPPELEECLQQNVG